MSHMSSAPVPSMKFFREYCAVLLELRDWAAQPPSPDDLTPATDDDTESVAALAAAVSGNGQGGGVATQTAAPPVTGPQRAHAIWNRLAVLLDRQLMEASRMAGPLGLEFHREAVYVMAALTDEMFVHLEWEGREFWLAHLLEARLFQSHFAGDQLFRKIDALLLRDDDPAGELAGVYLTALALGFRGRYWGPQHAPMLDRYRTRLFVLMSRRDPALADSTPQLFPEAYRNAIADGTTLSLPDPRRWLLVLGGLIAVWLIASLFIWHDLTAELNHLLCCLNPDCTEGCTVSASGSHK